VDRENREMEEALEAATWDQARYDADMEAVLLAKRVTGKPP
jgi:hypothetical protein